MLIITKQYIHPAMIQNSTQICNIILVEVSYPALAVVAFSSHMTTPGDGQPYTHRLHLSICDGIDDTQMYI